MVQPIPDWTILPCVLAFSHTLPVPGVLGYVDPGTGSFILQLLVAGLFGGLLAIKLFWNNIKSFFRRIVHKAEERTENDD